MRTVLRSMFCKNSQVSPRDENESKEEEMDKEDQSIVRFFRYLWIRMEDWVYLTILGLSCASIAVVLEFIISRLNQIHLIIYNDVNQMDNEWRIPATYGVWVGYVVILVLLSAACTKYIAVGATGSGFPEMKCILRGTILKEYLTFRTMIGKFIGLILSMSSGIPNGREGPLCHIFGAFAMQLSRFAAFTGIYSNESRCSEMLAAGAAVGVASTFSAPVGGVLLSIELTSVLFAVRNYWRSFYSASCSTLVILILLPAINDPLLDIQPQYQTRFPPGKSFSVQELPLFVLLGVIIGVISVLFIKFHRFWVLFLRRNRFCKKIFQSNFFVYPLVISTLVGTITYPESLGQFMAGKKKFMTTLIDFFATCTWSNIEGATSITDNYTGLHHDVSIFVSLSVFIIVHFFLSILCHTMPVPSGIIISSLGMGAAMGRLMGEIFSVMNDGFVWTGVVHQMIYPGVYAVAGSAAMVGSVTHTVSTAVIMFEMTGQLLHLLPVLITVITSNAVCSFFEISIIDSMIRLRKLPYLPDLSRGSSIFHSITASQFMISPAIFIHKRSTYREVRNILKESPKISTFPIVDSKDSLLLLGTVDRRKLERFLNERIDNSNFSNGHSSSVHSSSHPHSPTHIFSFRRMLHSWRKYEHETRNDIEEGNEGVNRRNGDDMEGSHLDEKIDLDSIYIDETPIQVTYRTSLFKIHWLFSLLSVNRIFITERGSLRGVIALKEVRDAIEAVHNGELKPNDDNTDSPQVPRSFLTNRKDDEESDSEEDPLQGRLEIIRGSALIEVPSQTNRSIRSLDPSVFGQCHSERMDHMTRERRMSRPSFSFSNIDQIAQLGGPPREILEIGGSLEGTIVLSILELFLCLFIWIGSLRLSRDDPSRSFVSTFSFQSGLTSILKGFCSFLLLNGTGSGVFSLLFTILTLIHRSSILLFSLSSSLLIFSMAIVSRKRDDFCSCSPLYHLISFLVFIILLFSFLLSDLLSSIPILLFHSINGISPILLSIVIIISLPIGGFSSSHSIDSRDKSIINARTRFFWTCIYVLPPVFVASLSYVSSISFILLFLRHIQYSSIPNAVNSSITQMNVLSQSILSFTFIDLLQISESSWSFHLFNTIFLLSTIFILPSYRNSISCKSLKVIPKPKEDKKIEMNGSPSLSYSTPYFIPYGDRSMFYSV
ncbi:hypothetical protein PRIPAC_79601 [Pristionchus pacificus]|uniref:Chloride channel protein n=1 Tax=Pristionchus pacificus TaxID=54126 RepID=A0A2A6BEC8_PRIPA|nr:hypothetical protein PRIPAC_79601 [Pristionchus pacificus]|eukprot:PDM64232.1 hypothetical protein PRIPAC_54476 [Pristionchus pacificus]